MEPSNLSTCRVAEDVAALSKGLEDISGPVHLVGHLYGGLVALEHSRQWPERVKSLYLYEPVLFSALRLRVEQFDKTAVADVKALFKLPCHVTLVAGKKSPATAKEMARLLAAELPNAELLMLPKIGHMRVLDRPDVVGPTNGNHLDKVLSC